jgi:hypothetical protein
MEVGGIVDLDGGREKSSSESRRTRAFRVRLRGKGGRIRNKEKGGKDLWTGRWHRLRRWTWLLLAEDNSRYDQTLNSVEVISWGRFQKSLNAKLSAVLTLFGGVIGNAELSGLTQKTIS